ncbi:hypothetical protein GGF37_005255 [Kickxella alabastrina]|nr:hypothetical protein GGF37_005255 [Kickxella alabastrina]
MISWKSIARSSLLHRSRNAAHTYVWKAEKPWAPPPSARYVSQTRTTQSRLSSRISRQFIQRKAN